MENELQIGIPYPPDEIFKFRKNIRQPAMKQLEEPNVSYIPLEARYEGGIFIWYKDVPFPTKGFVFPEAMYAINQVKRLVISAIRIVASKEMVLPLVGFVFSNKKKVLNILVNRFIEIVDLLILKPFYLEDHYYSPATKEIRTFIREAGKELGIEQADLFGEIISMLFQYDNAYYFRFIDIMSETDKYRLTNYFILETERLFNILVERDTNVQISKYRQLMKLMRLAWCIPSLRRSIKKGIEAVDFKGWQMDEADKYHSFLVGDYNYQGKSIEQRTKEYIEFHGGEDKLPPRIQYIPA